MGRLESRLLMVEEGISELEDRSENCSDVADTWGKEIEIIKETLRDTESRMKKIN